MATVLLFPTRAACKPKLRIVEAILDGASAPAISPTSRWRITRIKGNRAELLGTVAAADEQSAITQAIDKFDVIDPHKRKRLVAVPAND